MRNPFRTRITRRTTLGSLAAGTAVLSWPDVVLAANDGPFRHGVASGDPAARADGASRAVVVAPLRVALDRDGQPTTSPAAGLEGSMLPLAVQALSASGAPPPAVSREARDAEARALLAERDLRAVLDEFARRRVRVLVIKGAALAHSLYRTPGLRPRLDTDLLIAPADVERDVFQVGLDAEAAALVGGARLVRGRRCAGASPDR